MNSWKKRVLENKTVFEEQSLRDAITKFKKELAGDNECSQLKYVFIIKAKSESGQTFSLSNLTWLLPTTVVDTLVEKIMFHISQLDEYYKTINYDNISIYYKQVRESPKTSKVDIGHESGVDRGIKVDEKSRPFPASNKYDLPKTMDITKWDSKKSLRSKSDDSSHIVYYNGAEVQIKTNVSNVVDPPTLSQDYVILNNGEEVARFTDVRVDEQRFKRCYSNYRCEIIENGQIIRTEVIKKYKMLTPLGKLKKPAKFKVITFDIETFIKSDNTFEPYLCGFYSENILHQTYYLLDFESSEKMLETAIKSILIPRFNGFTVYIHNFGKFDSAFILNQLLKQAHGKVKIIKNERGIIKVTVRYGCNYKLYFVDSYQLLSESLEKLGIALEVETAKSVFPHSFASFEHLSYVGKIPNSQYWSITDEQYKEKQRVYDSYEWNFREEAKIYCNRDLICLYDVIKCFFNKVYDQYGISLLSYPTIGSLAMGIYRSNFMGSDVQIPLLNGSVANNIRSAYFGGIVDILKPTGTKLYQYDVNSLYPFMMLNDLPIGNPVHIKGAISANEASDLFGFFNCKIVAPKCASLVQFLPYKHEKRTITPVGSWSGWYFSEEIKKAISLGYQVSIDEAYSFKKGKIFEKFVQHFYSLKSKGPHSTIWKLILNSLYGKFGAKPERYKTVIVPSEEAEEVYLNYNVIDVDYCYNGYEAIRVEYCSTDEQSLYEDYQNASVAIAAAITASARIFMYDFKTISGNLCYYSDTDSVFVEQPLEAHIVGDNIGQFKLERIIYEAVFFAPKTYGLIDHKGNEIVKIKGFAGSLSYEQFKQLLNENTKLILQHEKWVINKDPLTRYSIEIKNYLYTLSLSSKNVRYIFNSGVLVGIEPIVLNDK
jgi:hypothetical protein